MSVSWTEDLLVVEIPDRGVPTVNVVSYPLQVEIAQTGLQGARGYGLPIVFGRKGVATVTTGGLKYRFPFATTLTGYSAALNVAPTGSALTADILLNGTVIATVTFSDGDTDVPTIPLSIDIVVGDYLTVEITGVGSTTPGEDLSIFITY